MKHHYILHRSFLILMFIVCTVAVVFFMKQRVNAFDAVNNTTVTTNTGTITTYPINGSCSIINGKTVTNKPIGILCIAGNQSNVVETATGWGWRCQGVNNGTTAYCSVLRYIQQEVINTDSADYANTNSATTDAGNTTNTATATNTNTNTNTKIDTANASVNNETAPRIEDIAKDIPAPASAFVTDPNNITNEDINNEASSTSNTVDRKNTETTTASDPANFDVTSMIAPIVDNGTVVIDKERLQIEMQAGLQAVDDSQNIATGERSEIINAPIVIRAKNLSRKNNPKFFEAVDVSLKVENVALNKYESGDDRLALTGKAKPNAFVTIYIFSDDPIVITVKADADGNWSYELDRELENGQHEAYVALTDDAGKIISKGQPIAFVKTAQAASVIPMSELTANQSPIKRSTQQYVLIAIMIMSVFLTTALIAIGFISHKCKLDEEIN